MASPKTQPTRASVAAFLAKIRDPHRRQDARAVAALMRSVTGARAGMWGSAIIGCGRYVYPGTGGSSGEWPLAAFAPRSTGLVIYLVDGVEAHRPLLKRLGKHKTGKCCLYIARLADVDVPTLRRLVTASVRAMRARLR